jgi:digeranylgeranylglycerophospholipid reductase
VKTADGRACDVLVIGGGPTGAVAARSAAAAGVRVVLIERRPSAEGPSACTGLVSPRTVDALGVSSASVLRRIRATEAFAPGGRRLLLSSDEEKALVLDRVRLETELIALAAESGAAVRRGVEAVERGPSGLLVRGPRGEETIGARVVVVATGIDSPFAASVGLPVPPRAFVAVQAVLARRPDRADRVSVYFGTDVAPGFFAWAVPAAEDELRVGLAVPPGVNPTKLLKRLIEGRFPDACVLSLEAGRIPIGPVEEPVSDGVLLVGDAAGQVKPLSGGGLYTGAICGRIAGRAAARAALTGRTNRAALSEYTLACDRAVGGEIRFGLAARALLESLGNEAIDDAFAAADHPGLLGFLSREGDIDRLRTLPRALASERALWRRLLPLLTLLDRHLAGHAPGDAVAASLPRNL